MRTINQSFETKDFNAMKKFKKKLSWRDFILFMYLHCKEAEKKGDFKIV